MPAAVHAFIVAITLMNNPQTRILSDTPSLEACAIVKREGNGRHFVERIHDKGIWTRFECIDGQGFKFVFATGFEDEEEDDETQGISWQQQIERLKEVDQKKEQAQTTKQKRDIEREEQIRNIQRRAEMERKRSELKDQRLKRLAEQKIQQQDRMNAVRPQSLRERLEF